MSSQIKRLAILCTWILGGLACILAGVYLRRAVVQVGELYRFVETIGSQVESDMDYYTHESRRAFLYALTMTDPNVQLPYIDESRQAEAQVKDLMRRIRLLHLSAGARRLAEQFEYSWTSYGQVRDAIVANILVGDTGEAVRVDRLQGRDHFEAALRHLHLLKLGLQDDARSQSTRVRATLHTCIIALGIFIVSMLTIQGGLVKANRDRNFAFQTLSIERASEQQRSAILEMVSTHAPLLDILNAILGLPSNLAAGTGAAIWAGERTELQFLTAKHLPAAFVQALQEIKYPAAIEDASERLRDEERFHPGAFGLSATDRVPLQNAAGCAIGLLQLFAPAGRPAATSPTLVAQMAQLAAIAIENRFMYERLAFQAQHDVLTELPNRLLFHDRVQQAIKLARRENTELAVIWLDLDRFKQINDSLGHRAGDELLCEVARRVSSCLRESDTVGRIGGDEFTILLGGLASVAEVDVVLRKILRSIEQPMTINKHEIAITASAGVSGFPSDGNEPGVLMRSADLAMYSAKHRGRNRYEMFTAQLGDSMLRRLEIESALKTALDRNEFSIVYQPLVAQGGRLDGLEALLRWKNSTLGQISPVEFIPIVEDMGMMPALGEWVIRTACQEGAKWLKAGYDVPRIAVNVSAVQFANRSLTATVQRALGDFEFPPDKLEIEVTETVLINNVGQVIEQIESIRHLGVKFAIDDFGTGYSSLNQLRTLPVDSVKIDRSFIKDLDSASTGSTTLVRGIVALAHNLQLKVVAEGVETKEQLALLATLGCEVSQGFFLYRPMPSSAVEAMLPRSTAEGVDSTRIVTCDPTPDERAWLAHRRPGYLYRREADLDAIARALDVGDLQCIQKIGHNMKGSGASYGFIRITEIGDHLESAAKAGDRVGIGALLRDLNGYLQSLDPQVARSE